jgi:uncharacterized membrane protein
MAFVYGFGFGFAGFIADILYYQEKSEIWAGLLGMLLNWTILIIAGFIGLGYNSHVRFASQAKKSRDERFTIVLRWILRDLRVTALGWP